MAIINVMAVTIQKKLRLERCPKRKEMIATISIIIGRAIKA